MSEYLYVKNFKELQHYKKRNPPWIKLYRALMTDGKFHQLSELEQWQLVRIWLVSAEEHPGGWVPNDESWLRRMTGTLRSIPIAKLVEGGWLIPMPASAYASAAASNGASNTPLNVPPMLGSRGSEVQRTTSHLPTVLRDDGGLVGLENVLKDIA